MLYVNLTLADLSTQSSPNSSGFLSVNIVEYRIWDPLVSTTDNGMTHLKYLNIILTEQPTRIGMNESLS